MGLTSILLEFNTKKGFDRLVRFLDEHYFKLLSDRKLKDYYVGSGLFAKVFHSKKYPDVVVRIGEQFDRGNDAYEKVIDKNFEHVVDVKFHRELKSKKGYFITVMEKLEPLDETLSVTVHGIKGHIQEILGIGWMDSYEMFELFDEHHDEFKQAYEKTKQNSFTGNIADWKEVEKYFYDIADGRADLLSIGISQEDLHTGNTMYDPRTRNYKIIDLA